MHATYLTHPILLDVTTVIIFDEETKSWQHLQKFIFDFQKTLFNMFYDRPILKEFLGVAACSDGTAYCARGDPNRTK